MKNIIAVIILVFMAFNVQGQVRINTFERAPVPLGSDTMRFFPITMFLGEVDHKGQTTAFDGTQGYIAADSVARYLRPFIDPMIWRGPWVSRCYEEGDVVRDGCWTMIADTATCERAGPTEDGLPEFTFADDHDFATLSNVSHVKYGQRYTFTQGGWLRSVRVEVPALGPSITYRFILADITDPNTPIVKVYDNPNLVIDEWALLDLGNYIVASGGVLLFYAEALNVASSLTISGDWTYNGTSQNGAPDPQGWNRTNQSNKIRVSTTDDAGNNRQADLLSVLVGSVVTFTQSGSPTRTNNYEIEETPTLIGAYVEYIVLDLGETGGGVQNNQLTNTEFEIPTPAATEYPATAGYWSTNQPTWAVVEGVLQFDGVDQGAILDGFGVDLEFQPALVPEDWSIVAYSCAGGSGGGGGTDGNGMFEFLNNAGTWTVDNWTTAPNSIMTTVKNYRVELPEFQYLPESPFTITDGAFIFDANATDISQPVVWITNSPSGEPTVFGNGGLGLAPRQIQSGWPFNIVGGWSTGSQSTISLGQQLGSHIKSIKFISDVYQWQAGSVFVNPDVSSGNIGDVWTLSADGSMKWEEVVVPPAAINTDTSLIGLTLSGSTLQAQMWDGVNGINTDVWAVDLAGINTDAQTLSFVSPNLSISGGNAVDLSALIPPATGNGMFDGTTNEGQDWTVETFGIPASVFGTLGALQSFGIGESATQNITFGKVGSGQQLDFNNLGSKTSIVGLAGTFNYHATRHLFQGPAGAPSYVSIENNMVKFLQYPNTRDDGVISSIFGAQDAGGVLGAYPIQTLYDQVNAQLPPATVDTDTSLIGIVLNGNTLEAQMWDGVNGINTDLWTTDLSQFLDNTDAQTLSFTAPTLSISNGNAVDLSALIPPATVNTDLALNGWSWTNSTSVLTLARWDMIASVPDITYTINLSSMDDYFDYAIMSGDNLLMQVGGKNSVSVDLSQFLDNTDVQDLDVWEMIGNDLVISLDNVAASNAVDLSQFLDNTDAQQMTLATNILSLQNGGTVDLSIYLDNTDAQTLSFTAPTLSISNGNAVDLSALGVSGLVEDQVLIGAADGTIEQDVNFAWDGNFLKWNTAANNGVQIVASSGLSTTSTTMHTATVILGRTNGTEGANHKYSFFAGSNNMTGLTTGRSEYSLFAGWKNGLLWTGTSDYNTIVGRENAGGSGTGGSSNSIFGFRNFKVMTSGGTNFASGNQNFEAIGVSNYNFGVGIDNFQSSTIGNSNIGIGLRNFEANTSSQYNIGLGFNNFKFVTDGDYNIGLGREVFAQHTGIATSNIGIGYRAGRNITSGSYNIAIGWDQGPTVEQSQDYALYIGKGTGTPTIFANMLTRKVAINQEVTNGFTFEVNGTTNLIGDLSLDADFIDINGTAGTLGQVPISQGGSGAGFIWSDAAAGGGLWETDANGVILSAPNTRVGINIGASSIYRLQVGGGIKATGNITGTATPFLEVENTDAFTGDTYILFDHKSDDVSIGIRGATGNFVIGTGANLSDPWVEIDQTNQKVILNRTAEILSAGVNDIALLNLASSNDNASTHASINFLNTDLDIDANQTLVGQISSKKLSGTDYGGKMTFAVQAATANQSKIALTLEGLFDGLQGRAAIILDGSVRYIGERVVTGSANIGSYDYRIRSETANDLTLTLPTLGSCFGCEFVITNLGSGTMTVSTSGIDDIDGLSSVAISNGSVTPQTLIVKYVSSNDWSTNRAGATPSATQQVIAPSNIFSATADFTLPPITTIGEVIFVENFNSHTPVSGNTIKVYAAAGQTLNRKSAGQFVKIQGDRSAMFVAITSTRWRALLDKGF